VGLNHSCKKPHLHVASQQVNAVHWHPHRLVCLHPLVASGAPLLSHVRVVRRQPQVGVVPLLQPPEIPAGSFWLGGAIQEKKNESHGVMTEYCTPPPPPHKNICSIHLIKSEEEPHNS